MAGRPPIDFNQKVRDLLTHTDPRSSGIDAPLRNFEGRTNACFNTLMVKTKVASGNTLDPQLSDLRYVKRFLVETADHTNNRIGQRLALLLTERYQDDPTLFVPQKQADSISTAFQQALTINGFAGTP